MPFAKNDPNINREGRPKGSFSLIAILKEELQKVPEGQKETAAYLLIQRMLKSAIADGNDQQIKNILQYVEGMPKQDVDVKMDLAEKLTEIVRGYYER